MWRVWGVVLGLAGLLVLLSGCASSGVPSALQDLSKFTKDDLQAAVAMAQKATDPEAPYRARCYTTLAKHVPDGSTVGTAPDIKGLVSLFEAGEELRQSAAQRAGQLLPPDIVADCAFLKDLMH